MGGSLVGLLAAAAPAWGQATLRGFVRDATSGEALIGANVVLRGVDDELRGDATDVDGLYVVTNLRPGDYIIQASYVGFVQHRDTIAVPEGVHLYTIEMLPDTELGEVTVEAVRVSGQTDLVAGRQHITPADIRSVPAPDITGDLANYLTTLPSVVTTGDQGGQLFIRGGEPTQNQVRLDGIPLYQPFHLLGFYSAFPADIVSAADLYAGGYGAKFGGFLSSVLDIASRSGNNQRLQASAAAAPFVASASVEGPIVPGAASFLLNGRLSLVDEVASPVVGQDLPYHFADIFAKIQAQTGSASQLSVTALHTRDSGSLGDPESDRPSEISWSNTAAGLRFLTLPASVQMRGEVVLTYTAHQTASGPDDERRESSIDRFGVEFALEYYSRYFNLNAGGMLERVTLDSQLENLYSNFEDEDSEFTEVSFYLEPEISVGPLQLRPGVRLTLNPTKRRTFIEPRARAILNLGRVDLTAAGGVYHQTLVGLSDRRDATSLFTVWTAVPAFTGPSAIHGVGGIRVSPVDPLTLVVEGWYKSFRDIFVAEWTSFPRLTTNLVPADGTAYGADGRIEYRKGDSFIAVNYGLASVRYEAQNPIYEAWFGTDRLEFRPPHDRRHQVAVFAGTSVAGFDVSARWQYGSGFPFSQPVGFDRYYYQGEPINPDVDAGDARVIYERPYGAELPAVHRLDVSVERTFDLDGWAVTAQVGVVNGYDRTNLLAFDLFTLRRTDQLPIVPIFGVRLDKK